jgi:hypothetical protein
MGKLVNGINGPFVGKIGNLVGSSRNGEHYVKLAYKSRTKNISKKEKANRSKFSMTHYWLQPLLYFVKVGFKDFKRSGEFNAAKSHLLQNAVEGTQGAWSINPALVKLSLGELPLSPDITVAKSGTNKIEFTWTYDKYDEKAHPADQVMMLAYDVANERAAYNMTGQFRSTGVDTLSVTRGKKYHIYLAFTSYDRMRQSDSVYLGEISM